MTDPILTFDATLEKAEEEDGKMFLTGVASTTDLDQQHERFTPEAIKNMTKSVGIPLTRKHANNLEDEIGTVVEMTETDGKLFIKSEIDQDDPTAVALFRKVQKGRSKVGFSVGGRCSYVAKAGPKVISSVALDHILLTKKPANPYTFAMAMTKALEDADAENNLAEMLAKNYISADDREKYATYTENGEGKFPIWNEQTAEAALHLIGHAPADKQALIKKKACSILGDSHPACKDDSSVSKGLEVTDEEKAALEAAELAKAGAKFSADTQAQLKDIHDAGSDDVKAKVRALLGDAAPSIIGDPDDAAPVSDSPIGVIGKEATTETLTKEDIAAVVTETMKSLRDELLKELVAEKPQPKGSTIVGESGDINFAALNKSQLREVLQAAVRKS